MSNNLTQVTIGNTLYNIKDDTARKYLIQATNSQPTSEYNQLWIKSKENSFTVPEYSEFTAVRDVVTELNAPFLTETELDEICGGDN